MFRLPLYLLELFHLEKSFLKTAVPGALASIGINWGAALVGIGAVIGMLSTLLVMLYGQIRIFMVMSRDGLLPKIFSKIHKKHKTPYIATIITGVNVSLSKTNVFIIF